MGLAFDVFETTWALFDAARDVAIRLRKLASNRWRSPGFCSSTSDRCSLREEDEIAQRTLELGLLGGTYVFLDSLGRLSPLEDAMFQGIFSYQAAHLGALYGKRRKCCDHPSYTSCRFGLGDSS